MTKRLFRYRSTSIEDDRRIYRWFDRDTPEPVVEHESETWALVEPEELSRAMAMKETIHGFASWSLPKWWPYAPRHDAKGRSVFHSKREAKEAAAKARHAGEYAVYDY